MPAKIPPEIREQQINNLPNIRFVRWDGEYKTSCSRVIVRCEIDDFEWSVVARGIISGGGMCPKCSGKRRWTPDERVEQINGLKGIKFIRWVDGYKNNQSKAVVRCEIDGFEWAASVNGLISAGRGCHHCAGRRRWTADERVKQINEINDVSFIRWVNGCYANSDSKAVVACTVDGHEWTASVNHLINDGRGCPSCAVRGFNPSKEGTLYALLSDCGRYIKVGISNDHAARHATLRANTPFGWNCIEMIHGDGSWIASLERHFHKKYEKAKFKNTFDGYTEWLIFNQGIIGEIREMGR